MKKAFLFCNISLIIIFLNYSCDKAPSNAKITYHFTSPSYSQIQLLTNPDTLRFALDENTYNDLKSYNYFTDKGKAYISFYDDRSKSINIYDFNIQQLVKKIYLAQFFKKKQLYKSSVHIQTFDSIFIFNNRALYLYDSAGTLKKTIDFVDQTDEYALFDNTQPPMLKENILFAGVYPWVKETSLSDLKRWKLLYGFNITNETKTLHYSLPEQYHHELYGYPFLQYSYCINDKGNFVFSFPADTNLYETNLADYHSAHYAKSRFQNENIRPMSRKILLNHDTAAREYLLRDSYGAVYFDPKHKRYLRLARQKATVTELETCDRIKKQSIIIFDENLKIIAEHKLEEGISFSSIFITPDGQIYSRVNRKDEYSLDFVRLTFSENGINSQLSKY